MYAKPVGNENCNDGLSSSSWNKMSVYVFETLNVMFDG